MYYEERDKLNELLLHEEVSWKQRAKTFWVSEGEENTKFFQANALARRKTNPIAYLINDMGTRVEDHNSMCDVVRDYFQSIFTGDPVNTILHQTDVDRCVTANQNDRLVANFSFENFIKNLHFLVARVFKARYYPTSHFLQATRGIKTSFIWSGIITAKNTMAESYRWVVDDGKDINAIKDQWLRGFQS